MGSTFVEGAVLGITLALLVGPAFIALVQTSINRGFSSGLQFAIGISLSDLTLIGLGYVGLLQIFYSAQQFLVLGIIGGSVMIGFGIITFNRKYTIPSNIPINLKVKTGRAFKYLTRGYFLNIFNPFLFIFWVGVMGLVGAKYSIPSLEVNLFFSGCIMAVFTTDLIKVLISQQIKRYLTVRVLTLLNRIVGSLLVLFGLVLIARVLYFL